MEDYKQALSLIHKDDKFYVMTELSLAQYLIGDHAGSIATLDQVIESQFEYRWTAYIDRGGIKFELGLYEDSIRDYSAYIQENPFHSLSYYWRSRVLIALGCFKEALADLDQAYQIQPRPVYKTEREEVLSRLSIQDSPPAICQSF